MAVYLFWFSSFNFWIGTTKFCWMDSCFTWSLIWRRKVVTYLYGGQMERLLHFCYTQVQWSFCITGFTELCTIITSILATIPITTPPLLQSRSLVSHNYSFSWSSITLLSAAYCCLSSKYIYCVIMISSGLKMWQLWSIHLRSTWRISSSSPFQCWQFCSTEPLL